MLHHFRLVSVSVALALAVLVAMPVGAAQTDPCVDEETGQLVLETTQTYIHQADTKVGNLAALDASAFPSWNETAPSQSVQQGAGGGYLGNFALVFAGQDDAVAGATFTGSFSGCLDTMLLELYAFLPTNRTSTNGQLQESPLNVYTSLEIDGRQLLVNTEIETKTIPNPQGTATYRIRYAYTGLHRALKLAGVATDGDHSIRVNATPRYANTSNAIFVYDTVEVPAGILFNGTVDGTYATVPTA